MRAFKKCFGVSLRTKPDVRIIDFVDTGHPVLLRMWDRRLQGYRAMGYRIAEEDGMS
jgi:hypothetical protein